MARDYKKEYANYHGKPEQRANRSARNKARRKAMAQGRARKGDGMDVHHVRPLAKGGARSGPTAVVSKSKNRSFARTTKARMK
jgi:hypothetical protein